MPILTDLAGLGVFGKAAQDAFGGGGSGASGQQSKRKRRVDPYAPIEGTSDIPGSGIGDEGDLNTGRRKRSNNKRY